MAKNSPLLLAAVPAEEPLQAAFYQVTEDARSLAAQGHWPPIYAMTDLDALRVLRAANLIMSKADMVAYQAFAGPTVTTALVHKSGRFRLFRSPLSPVWSMDVNAAVALMTLIGVGTSDSIDEGIVDFVQTKVVPLAK